MGHDNDTNLEGKKNEALELMGLKKPEDKATEADEDFTKKKDEALELMGIKKGGQRNV